MRLLKRKIRNKARLSIILVDWGVRESFHILQYLSRQTVDRELFEVIVVEFYAHVSPAVGRFVEVVDSWILLENQKHCYYHKHLLYNAGILLANGEQVMIVDSDAMVQEKFVEKIIRVFDEHPTSVLHVDQFRNNRQDLYPFNFPAFDEVVGEGCINNLNGRTIGLWNDIDPLHTRNYGACMCARKKDLLAIGGADEHIDYLGHICGPYEMTFRLVNYGRKEIWLNDEFTYHTWHPGQAGENNYVGPHDGRHLSSRALQAKFNGRILPFVENRAIQELRLAHAPVPLDQSLGSVLSEERLQNWTTENVANLQPHIWRTLLSFRRRVVALRLLKTFAKLLLNRVRTKAVQLIRKPKTGEPTGSSDVGQLRSSAKEVCTWTKAKMFLTTTLEFFVSMIHRSKDCLSTALAEGHSQVSLYGTDDLAEILYDLTFELPVKIKSVYSEGDDKRFHGVAVLPIEKCYLDNDPIIVTNSTRMEDKLKRLKLVGVSPDRVIVMI